MTGSAIVMAICFGMPPSLRALKSLTPHFSTGTEVSACQNSCARRNPRSVLPGFTPSHAGHGLLSWPPIFPSACLRTSGVCLGLAWAVATSSAPVITCSAKPPVLFWVCAVAWALACQIRWSGFACARIHSRVVWAGG